MRMSPGVKTAGKHIMPRLNAADFANDVQYRARVLSYVRELGVAGFCVFGGGEAEVTQSVSTLREAAKNKLIFSADCEFGLPMRFSCGTEFPDAMAIAKAGDPELARTVGHAIALEMRALGLGWNFAPVADVNSNPDNPIINTRSFGDDPATVSKYAIAYMQGTQSAGVVATAKHFPGHGDTSVDSHRALPYLEGDIQRFHRIELAPFQAMIDAGVQSVMTGHLAVPTLMSELGAGEAADLPATLSKTISTNLLRDRMGFQGLIVTDAMEMRAIRNAYGDTEATKMAFNAGADIVLMPPDVELAYDALANCAVRDYTIPDSAPREDVGSLHELERSHRALAMDVARRSVSFRGTFPRGQSQLLILTDGRPEVEQKAADFAEKMRPLFSAVRSLRAGGQLETSSSTVLAVFHRARGYIDADATEWTIPRMMQDLAERLSEQHSTLAGLILFGNPYLDRHFVIAPQFILKTFSESKPSILCASERLFEAYRSL